jgi:polysaccharide chain length determinant protein (PEP-CTERM system associated)
MTAPAQNDNDLQSLLDFLLRKKLVILCIAVPVALGAALAGLLLPNSYQSGISIFIEPQKVPQEYVRSTVTSDIESRIRTISQQLTSRTRLLRVMEEVDLYPEAMKAGVSRDLLVARMAKDIAIELPTRKGDDNYFRVTFIHADRRKAQAAVSRLVTLFINESLTVREQQAAGTTQFIEGELQNLKIELERQESAIQRFRQANMGELPEQLDANLRVLDNLNLQLTGNMESQREVENRVSLLEQEVARLNAAAQAAINSGQIPAGAGTTVGPLLVQREAIKRAIAGMEGSYTARHPDLVAARRELARVEEKLAAAQAAEGSALRGSDVPPLAGINTQLAGELSNARRQLNEARPRLVSLSEEEIALKEKIAQYQRRVETIPRREQELAGLTRDYENTKKNYEGLLSKKLDAQLSQNMEERQKGEQFRVLDAANLPDTPFSPNRKKILALGLAGSMGAGVGFAFLWEALFPAFFTLRQLKARVDFPVMVGIPHLLTDEERKRNRTLWLILGGTVLLALLAVHLFVSPLPEVWATIRQNLRGTAA